jgi:hypothetical protein
MDWIIDMHIYLYEETKERKSEDSFFSERDSRVRVHLSVVHGV